VVRRVAHRLALVVEAVAAVEGDAVDEREGAEAVAVAGGSVAACGEEEDVSREGRGEMLNEAGLVEGVLPR
jgi:predicted amidohydrolase YtcJ